jgi:hypothetical protein
VKLRELFFVCADGIDTNALARLTALRSLSLKGKVLSLEGLLGMKNLDSLLLSSTPFVSLEPLYSLSSLMRIFVNRKMISPELEAGLKTHMPQCRLVFRD